MSRPVSGFKPSRYTKGRVNPSTLILEDARNMVRETEKELFEEFGIPLYTKAPDATAASSAGMAGISGGSNSMSVPSIAGIVTTLAAPIS